MLVPKPMLTEFDIHYRLESCGALSLNCTLSAASIINKATVGGKISLVQGHSVSYEKADRKKNLC